MNTIRENARYIFLEILRANSEPEADKAAILGAIVPHLEALGFSIEIHENGANPGIYASTPSPEVLLSGHLDTVNIGSGWTRGMAEEHDGKIYGRGALDMKGPCVSMLIAAEELISRGMGVALTYTTDEEVGMDGAKVIAEAHPEISEIPLIIICEPTGMSPVFEEKGLIQFRIAVRGESAHGSMPELGTNAIIQLNSAISRLFGKSFFGQHSQHPVTLSIGKMSGGTLINMVADHAEAELDIRYSPDFSEAGVFKEIKATLDDMGIDYYMDEIRKIPAARSGISGELKKGLEELFGPVKGVPYATEMAVLRELNPNIFILGPGEPTRAHKPDEYMTMGEVFEGADGIIKTANLLKK